MGRVRRPAPLGPWVWNMAVIGTFWAVPSSALLLVLVLAGCTEPAAPVALPTDVDAKTCAIDGLVTDDLFNPLAGVQVGLLGTDPMMTAVSADDGAFFFRLLPPGVYTVTASLAGNRSDMKSVLCEADGKADVLLSVKRLPDPRLGFMTVFPVEHGRIGCGAGYYSLSTTDQCKAVGIDPDGRADIDYRPDLVPITGVVFEMEWTRTGTFGGDNLALGYAGFKAKASSVEMRSTGTPRAGDIVAGRSPMSFTARTLDLADPLYSYVTPEASLQLMIRPAGSADPANVEGSSKVVIGQNFNLYVALFYQGAPIPAGFTMLPP